MFQDLYEYLKGSGFRVFSLGQQDKICTNPFLVLCPSEDDDSQISKNLKRQSIEVWIFYPYNVFSQVEPFVKEVANKIKDFGKLRREYTEFQATIDNDMKAYYTKLTYFRYVYRKR